MMVPRIAAIARRTSKHHDFVPFEAGMAVFGFAALDPG
jgi:hypothetical protein